MSNLRKDIQLLLSSIREITKQLPLPKQSKASQSIQKIVSVHSNPDNTQLEAIKQQLTYKYNFFKLAYPHFVSKKQVEVSTDESLSLNVYWQSIIDNALKESCEPEVEQKGNTYVMKDGKMQHGTSQKKVLVDHQNWFAGNVDPDDLKRHKELLDRQHFRGPFWEGKPKPKSVLEEDPASFVKGEGEANPYFAQKGQGEGKKEFQKVKR